MSCCHCSGPEPATRSSQQPIPPDWDAGPERRRLSSRSVLHSLPLTSGHPADILHLLAVMSASRVICKLIYYLSAPQ